MTGCICRQVGIAAMLSMLLLCRLAAAATTQGHLSETPALATPEATDLKPVFQMPEALDWLTLDYEILNSTDSLDCDRLLVPAEKAAALDDRRPGPQLIIALCAHRAGNLDLSQRAWARMVAGVAAQTLPAGRVPGQTVVEIVGSSDIVAWLAVAELTAVSETLEVTQSGQRLERVIVALDEQGRERRLRFDSTAMIVRLIDTWRDKLSPEHRRYAEAAPARHFISVMLDLGKGDAGSLRAAAEFALRTGSWGGKAQAEIWLERAVALDDTASRYTYALHLLRTDADQQERQRALALLRTAGDAGLPSANTLLSLVCEMGPLEPDCVTDESAQRRALAIKALGMSGYQHRAAQLLFTARLSIHDRSAAIKLEEAAAEGGSTEAMDQLAAIYTDDAGQDADPARGLRWSKRSAKAGSAEGIRAVGHSYLSAKASARDQRQAVEWFRRAAEAGNVSAMIDLGNALYRGSGVEREMQQAAHWYALAARAGDEVGQNNYGVVLQAGTGIEQDRREAALWFRRSALQGYVPAERQLATILLAGDGMTQDDEQARYWLGEAAEQNDVEALRRLAYLQREGRGGKADPGAACDNFEKAAKASDLEATMMFGYCFEVGEGRAQDHGRAIELYRSAAMRGHAASMRSLAIELQDAPPPLKDDKLAFEWLNKAVAAGNIDARTSLGWAYQYGIGVVADSAQAAAWYQKGSDAEDPYALNDLGVLYRTGDGVALDPLKARELFERAIAGKSHHAMCNLGEMLEAGEGGAVDADRGFELQLKSAIAGNDLCARRFSVVAFLSRHSKEQRAQARDALRSEWPRLTGPAKLSLIRLLLSWTDGPEDRDEGAKKLLAMAETDDRAAHVQLADAYLNGQIGGKQDFEQARAWYQKAADEGDGEAIGQLALLYYYGAGVEADRGKARTLLETALKTPGGENYELDLARLYLSSGDFALAKPLLVHVRETGALIASLSLSRLCRAQPICDGSADDYAAMWRVVDAQSASDKNAVAWFLATDPLADPTEIQLALALMQSIAGEIDGKPALLDTLAVAYAAAGDFAQAIAVETHALEVAKAARSVDLVASLTPRLALFRQHRRVSLPW